MKKKKSFSRPLDNSIVVEQFLFKQLGYKGSKSIISKIVKGEIALPGYEDRPTSDSKEHRESDFRDDDKRWALRKTVVSELYNDNQLEDDNKIQIGNGGAVPRSGTCKEGKAFIIIGLPASGKSYISSVISEAHGAFVLDSDFAKRKLPEFANYEWGASLVHKESDEIIFGFEDPDDEFTSLFELVTPDKCNLVIPKIGQNAESVALLARTLKDEFGYEVHLVLVNLKKEIATLRAAERYEKSLRYVPLGLIFDGYGNDPILTYYYLKCREKDLFSSFGELSTEVWPPRQTDIENNSPVSLFL